MFSMRTEEEAYRPSPNLEQRKSSFRDFLQVQAQQRHFGVVFLFLLDRPRCYQDNPGFVAKRRPRSRILPLRTYWDGNMQFVVW